MKKALVLSLVLVVGVLALGSVNKVYASAGTPSNTAQSANYGFGGRGGMMVGNDQGLLHDVMVEVAAENLGISVDDLNARLTNGETLYSIALAEGLTAEEANTLMLDARNQAIDQAVVNGDLTQEQADWMKTRSTQMGATGTRSPRGTMGGMMGGTRGNGTGTGVCIN